MSLSAATCAMAMLFGDPCSEPVFDAPRLAPTAFASAVADRELGQIYGMGVPLAALDREGDAARVRRVDIAFNQARTSDQTRELFDNWNVEIATPLIAQATLDAGR